jgi:hypothetical protein
MYGGLGSENKNPQQQQDKSSCLDTATACREVECNLAAPFHEGC